MIRSLFAVLLLASSYAIACDTDADCEIGSHCTAHAGRPGVCSGGTLPGLASDRGVNPLEQSKNAPGTRCTSDVDCGYSGQCLKDAGKVYGTCAGGMGGGIHTTH